MRIHLTDEYITCTYLSSCPRCIQYLTSAYPSKLHSALTPRYRIGFQEIRIDLSVT